VVDLGSRARVFDHVCADLVTARHQWAGATARLFRPRDVERGHHSAAGWPRASGSRLWNRGQPESDRCLVWRRLAAGWPYGRLVPEQIIAATLERRLRIREAPRSHAKI